MQTQSLKKQLPLKDEYTVIKKKKSLRTVEGQLFLLATLFSHALALTLFYPSLLTLFVWMLSLHLASPLSHPSHLTSTFLQPTFNGNLQGLPMGPDPL